MICLHRLNPMPELDVLVVKKGTKILSRTSGKIPSPLSDIVNVGLPLEKNLENIYFYLCFHRSLLFRWDMS